RLEPLAAVVEGPNERDLGARHRLRGLRERAERIGRGRRTRRSRDRANERRERRGSETNVSRVPQRRIQVEQTGHFREYSGRSSPATSSCQSTTRGGRVSQTVPPHI